jgi:hypothetical protein
MSENYRGISLPSTTYKIITYKEYQVRFWKGISTMDYIFTMKQISIKLWECYVDLFQTFIDFWQAYDHTDRESMPHFHIPVKIIRLVKLTMINTESQVRVQIELTDSITTDQGLKQRDGLAPLLFNLLCINPHGQQHTNPHRVWLMFMTLLLSHGSCQMQLKYTTNWL